MSHSFLTCLALSCSSVFYLDLSCHVCFALCCLTFISTTNVVLIYSDFFHVLFCFVLHFLASVLHTLPISFSVFLAFIMYCTASSLTYFLLAILLFALHSYCFYMSPSIVIILYLPPSFLLPRHHLLLCSFPQLSILPSYHNLFVLVFSFIVPASLLFFILYSHYTFSFPPHLQLLFSFPFTVLYCTIFTLLASLPLVAVHSRIYLFCLPFLHPFFAPSPHPSVGSPSNSKIYISCSPKAYTDFFLFLFLKIAWPLSFSALSSTTNASRFVA